MRHDSTTNRGKKSFLFDQKPKKNKSTFDLQLISGANERRAEDLMTN
jgi:hypothetical protein